MKAVLDTCNNLVASTGDRQPVREHERLAPHFLFDASPFGMFILDCEGRIVDCNDTFQTMMGAPRQDLIGFNVITAPQDRSLVPHFQRALAGERVDIESRYTSTTGGRTSECRYVLQPLGDSAAGLAVLGYIEDVFERREMERARQALSLSEEILTKAFRDSPDPMVISDIATGRIREINHGFVEHFGYTAEESVGRTTVDLGLWVSLAQRDATVALMREQGSLRNHEVEFRAKSGAVLTVLGTSTQIVIEGTAHWLVQFRDITEQKRLQLELEAQAHTDLLTGVANRRYFMKLAESELARAVRYGSPLALLMLDVDHFKSINDTHGHLVGDNALQVLALTCQKALREVDILGRVGGEEFAILLPETNADTALEAAERVRGLVAGAGIPLANGARLHLSVSLGCAALRPGETNIDALIGRADQALYEAKRAGRDCVRSVG